MNNNMDKVHYEDLLSKNSFVVSSFDPIYNRFVLRDPKFKDKIKVANSHQLRKLTRRDETAVITQIKDIGEVLEILMKGEDKASTEEFDLGGIVHKHHSSWYHQFGDSIRINHFGTMNQTFGKITRTLLEKHDPQILKKYSEPCEFYRSIMPGVQFIVNQILEHTQDGLILSINPDKDGRYLVIPGVSEMLDQKLLEDNKTNIQRGAINVSGYGLVGNYGAPVMNLVNEKLFSTQDNFVGILLADETNAELINRDLDLSKIDYLCGRFEELSKFSDEPGRENRIRDISSKMRSGIVLCVGEREFIGISPEGLFTVPTNDLLDKFYFRNQGRERIDEEEIGGLVRRIRDAEYGETFIRLAQDPERSLSKALESGNNEALKYCFSLTGKQSEEKEKELFGRTISNLPENYINPNTGLGLPNMLLEYTNRDLLVGTNPIVISYRFDNLRTIKEKICRDAPNIDGEQMYRNCIDKFSKSLREARSNISSIKPQEMVLMHNAEGFILYLSDKKKLSEINKIQEEIDILNGELKSNYPRNTPKLVQSYRREIKKLDDIAEFFTYG